MAQTHSANSLYQSVISDVITSVRESFLDDSVDENVLLELKNPWVQKLEASKAVEQPQMGNDAAALDSKTAAARGGYRGGVGGPGGAAGAGQHVVINDPNRLVPVQITRHQRVRVESVCLRLGLTPLAFLWQRDQTELLREMISAGMESVLIKVACLGLDKRHLGKR